MIPFLRFQNDNFASQHLFEVSKLSVRMLWRKVIALKALKKENHLNASHRQSDINFFVVVRIEKVQIVHKNRVQDEK